MRIVHVSKVTGIAGSEGHLLRLLPGLAAHGHDVRMLVLEDPRFSAGRFCRALEARGIAVDTERISGHVDAALTRRLTHRFSALEPALVHTHLLHADWYGLRAAHRAGVRWRVSSRHNDDRFRRTSVVRWLTGRAMRHADRVIAVSDAVRRFVVEIEGIDAAVVSTVHYGLDAPAPDPRVRDAARATLGRAEGPIVGVVARLVDQKGVDVLLDALPAVVTRHPAAHLVVVGDGPLRRHLGAQTRRLGLDRWVTFAGWIDEASAVVAACDVIVVPSRWEGFGLIALEAMAAARPVVASEVGALPEIVVDRQTGLLVPAGDAPALAGALNALLDDPGRAAGLGEAGFRRLVEHFPAERMVHGTLEVYAAVAGEAMAGGTGPPASAAAQADRPVTGRT
jgi:glycosyltransferase involved in cell wall biosynthesis